MQQKINFNINQHVLVKLTEYGKYRLREDHYNFWNYSNKGVIPKFNLPKEDADGYSEWQLWRLMEQLGKYCQPGYETPFEAEIILVKDFGYEKA